MFRYLSWKIMRSVFGLIFMLAFLYIQQFSWGQQLIQNAMAWVTQLRAEFVQGLVKLF